MVILTCYIAIVMSKRTIRFIDPKEDVLQVAADRAVTMTMEERLNEYCQVVRTNFAFAGIDATSHPVKRTIDFIDEPA